jgi:hypothetical protein
MPWGQPVRTRAITAAMAMSPIMVRFIGNVSLSVYSCGYFIVGYDSGFDILINLYGRGVFPVCAVFGKQLDSALDAQFTVEIIHVKVDSPDAYIEAGGYVFSLGVSQKQDEYLLFPGTQTLWNGTYFGDTACDADHGIEILLSLYRLYSNMPIQFSMESLPKTEDA